MLKEPNFCSLVSASWWAPTWTSMKKRYFTVLMQHINSQLQDVVNCKRIRLEPKMCFSLDVLHPLRFRDLQGRLFFGLEILIPGHFPKIVLYNYTEQRVTEELLCRTAPFWVCTTVEDMANSESTYVSLYEGQLFNVTWINTPGTSKPGVCTTSQVQHTQGAF